ncbi:peptidase family M13 protein [Toxoplasma gondii p89]|uniref:Peptidase family M13 protein n=2 Tax=Toxoplasma gondii TaxID=5811 RepID=A0A2T6IG39_TOXGO|nr:peptidase family M13 protein [Toxoplasma gondii p89]PUA84302.1 peptidase family M13 protein [Toxoplasma gondii TgCATBr9]
MDSLRCPQRFFTPKLLLYLWSGSFLASLLRATDACSAPQYHPDNFELTKTLERRRLEPVSWSTENKVLAPPKVPGLLAENAAVENFVQSRSISGETADEQNKKHENVLGSLNLDAFLLAADAGIPAEEQHSGTVNADEHTHGASSSFPRSNASSQTRSYSTLRDESRSTGDTASPVEMNQAREQHGDEDDASKFSFPFLKPPGRYPPPENLACVDSAQCARIAEMIKRDMNPRADPCYDAEEYFCGGWKARTSLPADESSWTLSFDTLARDTRDYLKTTLEARSCSDMRDELHRQTPQDSVFSNLNSPSSVIGETGNRVDEWDVLATCMYEACMDEEAIDARGATPLTDRMFGRSERGSMSLEFLLDTDFEAEAIHLAERGNTHPDSSAISTFPVSREAVLVQRLQAIFHRLKDVLFWSAYVGPNELHPDQGQTLNLGSLKLGLSYHFYEEDHLDYQRYYKEHMANILQIFEAHLLKTHPQLLARAQKVNPNLRRSYSERAQRIFDLEKNDLRPLVLSPEETRKVTQYTHEVTFGELKASTDALDVEALLHLYLDMLPRKLGEQAPSASSLGGKIAFTSSGVVVDDSLVLLIHEKNYFAKLETTLRSVDWDVLHDYILYKVVRSDASMLSRDFRDEIKRYSKQVTKAEPLPRWRTCVSSVPQWILARRYVLGRFDRQKKQTVQLMVTRIRSAFKSLLEEYAWMDEPTRAEALEKLAGMQEKIGFPDWLLDDYETYFTRYYGDKSAALELASIHFEVQWHLGLEAIRSQLAEFGEPVDRREWAMKPHSVNAYFSPSQNEIAFMAAVLQEPSLFVASPHASLGEDTVVKALSYGAIAGVIAHEITHGFDDVGKEYDVKGRLRNWWTPESEEAFKAEATCMKDQYSGYSVVIVDVENDKAIDNTRPSREASEMEHSDGSSGQKTVRVRGDLTLGENIADNGGIQLAWAALKLELSPEQLNSRPLENYGVTLTTAQLFTFSWGHFWCEIALDSFIRRQVETDPHSPARFRIQGPLANFGLFAEQEQCPVGSLMNPETKCRVW